MNNVMSTVISVVSALVPVVVFGGIVYADVNSLKIRTDKLEENVIYINTEMVELQKEQLELLFKMDARLTILESKDAWEAASNNNSQSVVITGKGE